MEYKKVSIRSINAFLRKKGIDPDEFGGKVKRTPRLSRKQKRRIEELADAGAKVLVYTKKSGRFVIKDADKKFNFERPEIRKKAQRRLVLSNGQHKTEEVAA